MFVHVLRSLVCVCVGSAASTPFSYYCGAQSTIVISIVHDLAGIRHGFGVRRVALPYDAVTANAVVCVCGV